MKYFKDGEPQFGRIIRDSAIVVGALIFLMICWPLYTVPTGSRGVVTVGGAIRAIQGEGFTFLLPWEKLSLFSIRSETADINNAEGGTMDTQPVHVSMTVRYSIRPDKVSEVFEKYSHDGNLLSYVQTATAETFKAVTARYVAPDLLTKRGLVSSDINSALQAKLDKYGAQVINVDMTQFAFNKDYMDAINDKVSQEQKRLAADNKLKTVESEQKQKVAVALADAAAVKATADGEAYKNLTIAKAQADALRAQNAALRESKDVLELRRIEVEKIKAERWGGEFPQVMFSGGAGGVVPFMDISALPARIKKGGGGS